MLRKRLPEQDRFNRLSESRLGWRLSDAAARSDCHPSLAQLTKNLAAPPDGARLAHTLKLTKLCPYRTLADPGVGLTGFSN